MCLSAAGAWRFSRLGDLTLGGFFDTHRSLAKFRLSKTFFGESRAGFLVSFEVRVPELGQKEAC